MLDRLKSVLRWFADKRWALSVAVVMFGVGALADFLEIASATSGELLEVPWTGWAPILAAFVTQTRVWSKSSVDELRGKLRDQP